MIQDLDDTVQEAKAKALSTLSRRGGAVVDPFRQAAKDEREVRDYELASMTKAYDDLKNVREKSVGTSW